VEGIVLMRRHEKSLVVANAVGDKLREIERRHLLPHGMSIRIFNQRADLVHPAQLHRRDERRCVEVEQFGSEPRSARGRIERGDGTDAGSAGQQCVEEGRRLAETGAGRQPSDCGLSWHDGYVTISIHGSSTSTSTCLRHRCDPRDGRRTRERRARYRHAAGHVDIARRHRSVR